MLLLVVVLVEVMILDLKGSNLDNALIEGIVTLCRRIARFKESAEVAVLDIVDPSQTGTYPGGSSILPSFRYA
jgi:hypothetical protein